MKSWKVLFGYLLPVIGVLSIACTSDTVAESTRTIRPVNPELADADSAPPTPVQSPSPAPTLTPQGTTAEPSPAQTAPEQSGAEAAPDELATYALEQVTVLSQTLGPRPSTTAEEKEAAEYLASQFAQHGFSVELQPFTARSFSREDSGLFLLPEDAEKIRVAPISGTAEGDVSGLLVSVGLARPEDIPDSGLVGKIALVRRGLIPFAEKAASVAAAGALGAVIYNNEPGNFLGTLGGSSDIPVASMSQEDGQQLTALLASSGISGPVLANLRLIFDRNPSQNVIAEQEGDGAGVVVLGAHYDTVPDVPGANDNASGTAVLLTLARELSQQSFPFDLRLVAFGSEELGLLGSRHYVESLSQDEQGRIIAMLNFDALGNGTRLSVLGDSSLTKPVMEASQTNGIDLRVRQSAGRGGSDHASFAEVGIPTIFFASNDFSRLHTSEDTLEHINPRLLGDAVRLGLNLLNNLAQES